ncbi:MAG: PIN domain-containing protein [Chloroflexi bacterium]|nr:PIN domain-containing protein [Chloroflexota bacterium]MCC6891926.1 PIN domain-containing protein [Anaerolineae bacterium]
MTKTEVIADTSFVVAVMISTDRWHQRCVDLFNQYDRIYLPQSALAEIAFMITRLGGRQATLYFFQHLNQSPYELVALIPEDIQRTADLLDQYADARPDFVDLSIVAVAERMNVPRILTLDRRDFEIIRPRHIDHFELLP